MTLNAIMYRFIVHLQSSHFKNICLLLLCNVDSKIASGYVLTADYNSKSRTVLTAVHPHDTTCSKRDGIADCFYSL